jgi:hypothetical protein
MMCISNPQTHFDNYRRARYDMGNDINMQDASYMEF